MPIQPVLQLGDPLLRELSLVVADPASPRIRDLVRDLGDTLAHWRSTTGYGRGIAAPQIGVMQRGIFLTIFMQVERRRRIIVRYQNLQGETLEFEAGDDRNLAELLQHEIDHLDGILAIDRVVDLKTVCTREEFEKRYRDASPYATAPATMKN